MIVRMRILAEAPPQVWIAISGTLGPATIPRVRQGLHERIKAGTSIFFLDLREVRCACETDRGGLRTLFAVGPGARFHVIGAPAEIRHSVRTDPRLTLHSRLDSAWQRWAQD
ncbi:hypothetical protein SAMN05428938_8126 [Streptomyces sp. KS_5]|nr:hypothetical protein SAMN05428938_8126 [Streptomyces sp. KS_5]